MFRWQNILDMAMHRSKLLDIADVPMQKAGWVDEYYAWMGFELKNNVQMTFLMTVTNRYSVKNDWQNPMKRRDRRRFTEKSTYSSFA